MRLLLDTHVLIWAVVEPEILGATASSLLTEGAEDVWVSAVSLWEIAVKDVLGRSPVTARQAQDASIAAGFRLLSLAPAQVLLLPELPFRPDHRDPFDRMLLVQAKREGLTLMTEDRKMARYGVPTIGCRQ